MLAAATRPLILMGRVSRERAHWDRRVALAEALGATVLTDLKTGATFPTAHALHPYPPGLYVSPEAGHLVRDADVVLALDWVDIAGTLRQACGGCREARSRLVCSRSDRRDTGGSICRTGCQVLLRSSSLAGPQTRANEGSV